MKKTPLTYARELHTALLAAPEAERTVIIRELLANLSRSRKSNLRPRIFAAFRELALAAEGYRAGVITTARPLDAALRGQMKKNFKNVVFEERTDPSLLGGAVVQVEDTRIDGSVRTKLDELKRTLARPI
jgi:F-type H+-transporting ATPase subunit delta